MVYPDGVNSQEFYLGFFSWEDNSYVKTLDEPGQMIRASLSLSQGKQTLKRGSPTGGPKEHTTQRSLLTEKHYWEGTVRHSEEEEGIWWSQMPKVIDIWVTCAKCSSKRKGQKWWLQKLLKQWQKPAIQVCSIPISIFTLDTRSSRVLTGVPLGVRESSHRASNTGTGNRLKQWAQFISGSGKPYIPLTLPGVRDPLSVICWDVVAVHRPTSFLLRLSCCYQGLLADPGWLLRNIYGICS